MAQPIRMRVKDLRLMLDGLPGDMPVLAPVGTENAACSIARATVAKARNEAQDGSSALWGVDAGRRDSGHDSYDEEYCCGEPMHGPVVSVLWLD